MIKVATLPSMESKVTIAGNVETLKYDINPLDDVTLYQI